MVFLAFLPAMASCGSIFPPEGPSLLAQKPIIDSGPSGQRRGPDGYVQLGAFPNVAASQLPDSTVVAERTDLKTVGTAQNGLETTAAADYQRSLAEAKAAKLQQRKEIEASLALDKASAAKAAPAGQTSQEILLEIEGR